MGKIVTVMVGAAVRDKLCRGECCQNCKHVVRKSEYDSPDTYACAFRGKPPAKPTYRKFGWWKDEKKKAKMHRYDLWWDVHFVREGTMCRFYKRKRISVRFVSLETDATRQEVERESQPTEKQAEEKS